MCKGFAACGCECSPAKTTTQGDDMSLSGWKPITIVGHEDVPCHAAFDERDGHIHAWASFVPKGKRAMMVHASTDLSSIESELMKRHGLDKPGAEASGLFSKLKNKIKKAARKLGKIKVLKAVVQTAQRALKNPLVQAALVATPYGAGFLAARAAARLAAKAIKGVPEARRAIAQVYKGFKAGNPASLNAMRLLRSGAQLYLPKVSSAVSGCSEAQAFQAIAGACAGSPDASIGCDSWHASGDALVELGAELEALEEFSTSGNWDGLRWVASRLGLHSMENRPDELTARGALLEGRQLMAQRFAH